MADDAGRSYRVRERARDTIRFEEDLRRRIIATAEQDGTSQNEVVNQLCQRALDAVVLGKGDVPTLLQQVLQMLGVLLRAQTYTLAALTAGQFNSVTEDALAGAEKVIANGWKVVNGGPADAD